MNMKEEEIIKKRPKRPIVRLGIFLISHSLLVSVVCCTAGVVALLLLPVLAKNTYVSENALIPGSANTMISSRDVSEANQLVMDLNASNLETEEAAIESRRILAKYISNLGAEVSYHKFHLRLNHFNPLGFFSSPDFAVATENFSCSQYGINTVGIIRAPRGDGKEAIVLVTPFSYGKSGLRDTLSLSISYAVFSLLSRVTWLAKDIIWLIADSRFGEYAPVASWLKDYHTPVFTGLGNMNVNACGEDNYLYMLQEDIVAQRKVSDDFRRAGTMAAALVLKVSGQTEQWEDSLTIYAEASNGQMPNLDLINVVNYLAVHRQGLHVKVEKLSSLLDSKWLQMLGEMFELVGKVARMLNPGWKFGIPASDYIEGAATLASSLYHQALGVPTGPHGAFREFQVDAITLEISPKLSYGNKPSNNEFILQGGRLMEGVIRSVNNLLEKFHQSFFLYLLTSPSKFVSVGVYMIAFALLVAPLPLVAASLYADANDLDLGQNKGKPTPLIAKVSVETPSNIFRSWIWLDAAKEVFLVHIWSAFASSLPHFLGQRSDWSPATGFLIWVSLSLLSLLMFYLILGPIQSRANVSQDQKQTWVILKSVNIASVFIGLHLMSVVNFATAEIGALLIVPTCLMARPFKHDKKSGSLRSFLRIITNLVLVLVSFPPAAFFTLKAIFGGFDNINIGEFWSWMQSLWTWNSATYVYIGIVHLPCWVLCLRILLHSC